MIRSVIEPIHNNIEKSYKCICDGLGCSNDATEKIAEKAGKFGIISLNLCSQCAKKFQ